ncbi:glycoside hydrolase family 76 protein [Thermoanaerobacter uzonensis]|uniref:glycoside hydrolase family 76 protein n=1 Tax=Thermoanaerobacter uzonensis TaxID=447593 RepID=UPI003D767747
MIILKRLKAKIKGIVAIATFTFFILSSIATLRVEAFTSSNADDAMTAFNNVFWDSTNKYFYTNSDHQIHSEHAFGPDNGLYSDFWWEAQLWDTVMDAYQRTNNSFYRQQIDDVYDGFLAFYPNFDSKFNDDRAWWALACARAYEITGETRYKDSAKSLFDNIYTFWDTTYGGGIWWKNDGTHDEKNVATNATAAIVAVKLSKILNDSTYLTKAQNIYNWVKNTLTDGNGHVYDHISGSGSGTVYKWDFSYNFGVFIGSGVGLYKETNTASYLNDATNAANWAVNNLTSSSTMMYEGVNDAGGFKMILARYMYELVTQCGQTQYLQFLRDNATQAWNHRRLSDNIVGADWGADTPSTYIQSLTAAAAVSILNRISADNYIGYIPGNGKYEAENATISGISSESSYTGFSGRGYLAGWNTNGTWVEFKVNVNSTGKYIIKMGYSAGAGNASRNIIVNGSSYISNLTFPGTGNWSTWNIVTLNDVPLNAGSNTIRISYDSSLGNTNYLNFDYISVYAMYEAEEATLHNLTTESKYAGYTGTGYIAGWNKDGQWVDFNVNVAKGGTYTLVLRYAAGAGDASRYIYVNGNGIINNLLFSGTGSWSSYNTVSCSVPLNAGLNIISIIYNSSMGSTNWLNLDNIVLVQPSS